MNDIYTNNRAKLNYNRNTFDKYNNIAQTDQANEEEAIKMKITTATTGADQYVADDDMVFVSVGGLHEMVYTYNGLTGDHIRTTKMSEV